MPAALVYEDGSFTEATPVNLPMFSAPFADQGINEDYILTQDYVQNLEDYAPLALDTPHDDYLDFMLASEGPKQDIGGGKVQWTRIYAKLPDAFSRPAGNVAYNFIGFAGTGGINVPSATYRPRFTANVPCRKTLTFYRTSDPDTDITFVDATRYYFESDPNQDVDFLTDNPPFTWESTPSRAEYETLIADDEYNITIEPARVSIWMGNIYVQETLEIKAR